MKILFIGGFGRSGSTLLDVVLGQYEKIVNIGELRHLWQRGLLNNELCGCGQEIVKCELWNEILYDAFGDIECIKKICYLVQRVDKPRYLSKLILKYDSSFNFMKKKYVSILKTLYTSIFKITKAEIIIDSSKTPSHGFILYELKDCFDIYFLHLVRNPKAVAYSWKKKKVRPEIKGKKEFMPRYGILKSAIWWNGANIFSEILKLYLSNNMFIKYESFVQNPKKTIYEIFKFLNFYPYNDVFINNEKVFIKKTHTVAGNPIRFKTGIIKITPDEEWKRKLKFSEKLIVDMLTFPLAKKYSY